MIANYINPKWTLGIFFLLIIWSGCRKEEELLTSSSARLGFSTDTLTFDTVFTQIGSATRRFTIRNGNDGKVRISNIALKNGDESNFRFNVDGVPGPQVRDLEIRGNDSAFVFVEVTVDPNNQSSPLVIFDALTFELNGNRQEVVLEAWGQDAYYYRPTQRPTGFPALSFLSEYEDYFPISTQIELPNDKPHVIFGYLVIDSLVNLTIPEGTQIHLYDGAGFWAYRGSNLKVKGSRDNEVVFQGYRLESFYDEQPGQWDRIILNESPEDHVFEHAIIKNGFIGISAEYFFLGGPPQVASNKVHLYNTEITNMQGVGMLIRNYNSLVENCLITNAQNQLVATLGGGEQRFIHSTLANYWSFGNRQEESFYAANAFQIQVSATEAIEVIGDQSVYFGNSIIYGPNREELGYDTIDGGTLTVSMDHCVVKTELTDSDVNWFVNTELNPETPFGFFNPIFSTTNGVDAFQLHNESAARDKGSLTITDTLQTDLAGNIRDAQPDLGAYEYQ
jgi:hypothetical protein